MDYEFDLKIHWIINKRKSWFPEVKLLTADKMKKKTYFFLDKNNQKLLFILEWSIFYCIYELSDEKISDIFKLTYTYFKPALKQGQKLSIRT